MTKVVLSRKGFDSKAGGMYLPMDSATGEYVFLPRPEKEKMINDTYTGIEYEKLPSSFACFKNIKEILEYYHKLPDQNAHLDPDLVKVKPDLSNWKATFGQKGPAQGYLRNQGVGKNPKGTLFLFFSRFKPLPREDTYLYEGYYIYGWLEVDHTIIPSEITAPHPLDYHPHFSPAYKETTNNIIYVGSETITGTDIPGAGMFRKLSDVVRLSYHNTNNLLTMKLPIYAFNTISRFKNFRYLDDNYCFADWPQGYGQESVFPAVDRPTVDNHVINEMRSWAINIIEKGIRAGGGVKVGYL